MELIIETDLGRDPDDFFAIIYLLQTGIDISLICIQPGDPDQIGFGKAFLKACGKQIPIVSSKLNRNKSSLSGPHKEFANKMSWQCDSQSDGIATDLLNKIWNADTEFFVCGPCSVVGPFVKDKKISKLTMQGGYISYEDLHALNIYPVDENPKFLGQKEVPSFNPGGDKKATFALSEADISDRRFVSKNICHTILYDRDRHQQICTRPSKGILDDMFRRYMDLFLQNQTHKAFHDPVAAVCHMRPELATWVRGDLYYKEGKWGFNAANDGKSQIIGELERIKFWEEIASPYLLELNSLVVQDSRNYFRTRD